MLYSNSWDRACARGGLKDILIAVVDGLSGFPEAIETAYPRTLVQTGAEQYRRCRRSRGSGRNGRSPSGTGRPGSDTP